MRIRNPFSQKSVGFFPLRWVSISDPDKMNVPYDFYLESLYFNKALEKRASLVGGVDYIPYKENGDVDEELYQLLKNPNDILSGDEFFYLAQLHYDIFGKFYIWKQTIGQKITELHLLSPESMEEKYDEEGSLSYYYNKKDKQRYEIDEIIWQHNPDPADPRKAVSILTEGGKDVLRAEIRLRDYQMRIIKDGGRIDGVLTFDTATGLKKEQIEDLKNNYKEQIIEAKEAQMPLFLGGKASFQDLNRSPREIGYLESKKAVLEEVSTLTGVPKTILSSFEDIKFANAHEARVTFLKETIRPLVNKLAGTLTQRLAPDGVEIGYADFIPEDEDAINKKVLTLTKARAITVNEIREEYGYEPIEGGDEIKEPISREPNQEEINEE